MKRRITGVLLALLIAAGMLALLPQSIQAAPEPTEAPVPTSAWDLMPLLNVGWSLGNSLENQTLSEGFYSADRFSELETRLRNPVTTEEVIDAIATTGFSCIRIPVSFYNHLIGSEPAENGVPHPGKEIDPEWLKRVEEVVKWATDRGLYVIINNHHDSSMWSSMSWIHADKSTYETDRENYMQLWWQVADHFKDYDHHLIFQSTGEIVNTKDGDLRFTAEESYADFQVAHDYNQDFIDTIRKFDGYNKDRFLILETYGANAEPVFVDQCFYKPYRDDGASNRLIFGVHCYHDDPEELRAVFKGLAIKSVQYGMPFIVDECGTKYHLDQAQRVAVAKTLSEESARYGAAVIIWDDGYGEFGLLDRAATIQEKETIAYTKLPGNAAYELRTEDIVWNLLTAKNHITPLTRQELRALYDNRYQVTDFTGLNASNTGMLKAGEYSQTHVNAYNPVSEYIPTPAHYAALCPYVYAEGAHFQAALPSGMSVIVREHDKNGRYIGTVVVNHGGYYLPSDRAAYLGISLRGSDKSLRLSDYVKMVESGSIRLYQNGYDFSAYSVKLKDAVRSDENSVTVTWEALQGAGGYRVMRRAAGESIWTPVGELLPQNQTSYTDPSATAGTEYEYTVKPFINRKEAGMSFRLFGGYDHQGVRSHF